MFSFILVILLLLSGIIVYRRRFTSGVKIGGLYWVQLYYLFLTPVGALLMFDVGSDIFSRPHVGNVPIPGNILFNIYNFSVMMIVVGVGIHSTATSVFQSFKSKDKLEKEAYHTNELIHGPWSHNMSQVGAIMSVMLLGLLELNHPYFGRAINFNLLLLGGITLGILGVISVLRSAYISFPLVTSFIGSVLVGYGIRNYALNLSSYPMAIVSLSALVTMFALLSLAALIFAISETLSKKVVSRTFPKGHPFHEEISLKVLTMRIEKEFAREREKAIFK